MVDPGRSDVEGFDGGGLDGRWWLTRENRRFKASVADANRGPFPARWGGENDENHQVFFLQQGRNLSVVVRRLETAGKWRSDERESVAGERREGVWEVLRCERAHGATVQLKAVNRWIAVELILQLWLAGSAGDRTVRMSSVLIWCDAMYRDLGTLGDVAPLDLRENCFKGWDWFGF
jgi:hypothetical protein